MKISKCLANERRRGVWGGEDEAENEQRTRREKEKEERRIGAGENRK